MEELPPPPPGESGYDSPAVQKHRMPGWVKGLLIAGIVVGVLASLGLALSGGSHGPGRHQTARGDAELAQRHVEPASAERP